MLLLIMLFTLSSCCSTSMSAYVVLSWFLSLVSVILVTILINNKHSNISSQPSTTAHKDTFTQNKVTNTQNKRQSNQYNLHKNSKFWTSIFLYLYILIIIPFYSNLYLFIGLLLQLATTGTVKPKHPV